MSYLNPAQTPAIEHEQETGIDAQTVDRYAVFQTFNIDGVLPVSNYIGQTNSLQHYQLRSSGSVLGECFMRMRLGAVNNSSSNFVVPNGSNTSTLAVMDLADASPYVRYYHDGSQVGTDNDVSGQSMNFGTLALKTLGNTSVNVTHGPIYQWINTDLPTAQDITDLFNGEDPSTLTNPPNYAYPSTGTDGAYAGTIADSGANNDPLVQVAGDTDAGGASPGPNFPTFVGGALPNVPVGYTRYTADSGSADTGAGSIFEGLTITDGSLVDIPDAMLEVGPPAGYMVLDGSDITGHVIRPVPGSYTIYIYDGATGDYDSLSVNYSSSDRGYKMVYYRKPNGKIGFYRKRK